MSETATANRWVPYQCPTCFGLFRIKKSQMGQAGRCPVCSSVVRPSAKENRGILEQAASSASDHDNLLEKVAVAKAMTPDEIAGLEAARKKGRRRQHVGEEAEGIDWEDEERQEGSKEVSWRVVASILLSAFVLLALSIFYYQRLVENPTAGFSEPLIDREKADALLDEIEKAEQKTKKIEEGEIAAKIVDGFKKFDNDKLEEAVKNFVNAESPAELKKYIREAERVGPLIDRYYEQVAYEAAGFESLNRLELSYLGEILTTSVTTADFLSSPIAVERVVDGDKESYQVDWESWVGYCDYPPEEMREKKPDQPFLMRVIMEPANYYNYGFSDDRKWRSLGLELKDSVYSFLGYVARDSEQDKELQIMMKNANALSCLIKVAYPSGARAKDQVEILEIVAKGWVTSLEKKRNE
jgi:hypothetical protein